MDWKKAIALTGVLAGVWASHAITPPLNTNRTEVLDYFAENVYGRRPDLLVCDWLDYMDFAKKHGW